MTYAERLKVAGGVWRTARKNHTCNYLHREVVTIASGDRYFDTGEYDGIGNFTTIKMCATCANTEIKGE